MGGDEGGNTCKTRTIDVWCTGSYPLSTHQAGSDKCVYFKFILCTTQINELWDNIMRALDPEKKAQDHKHYGASLPGTDLDLHRSQFCFLT